MRKANIGYTLTNRHWQDKTGQNRAKPGKTGQNSVNGRHAQGS